MDFSSAMDKAEFRKMLGEILLRTVWSDGAWYFPTIEILPKAVRKKLSFNGSMTWKRGTYLKGMLGL